MFSAVASAKQCIVHAFEPMQHVIDMYLSKTATWNDNIKIVKAALWHEKCNLEFNIGTGIGESGSTRIGYATPTSKKKTIVNAIRLDDYVTENNLQKVDFIKADIEGAERNMLRGAKETLRRFAPKLSLCTYHLPDDPQVMKELILDANPKYIIKEKFKKLYAYAP
jgi:FkbM family methyltransferase